MAKATEQQKTESVPVQEVAEGDDAAYIAEVLNVYGRTGAGGDVSICRVLLRHNNRAIFRSVEGPVAVGDLLSLRECVRESRKSR